MNEIIIIFASATTASRVKKHLVQEKYYAKVIQTPKNLSEGGCSYCVHTTADALDEAKLYAKKLDVKIKAVYKTSSSGYAKIQR